MSGQPVVPDGEMWSVSLPYATFAIVIRDGRCAFAAPIAGWMRGHTIGMIEVWVRRKGGRLIAPRGGGGSEAPPPPSA